MMRILFLLLLSVSAIAQTNTFKWVNQIPYLAAGTNTYTVTIGTYNLYKAGDEIKVTFANANTGNATINVNGLGAVNLRKNGSTPLSSGDIAAGSTYILSHDGTNFQVLNIPGAGGGGSSTTSQVLQIARKATAGTINKGQVVYITGSSGTHMLVELARANIESTSAYTIGIAASQITNTTEGEVITNGLLTGLSTLPTSSYADGDVLYLSEATAGAYRKTLPTAPNHGVFLGFVKRASNGGAGEMLVNIINYQELEELSDVAVTSPANNDFLIYNGTNSRWEDVSLSTVQGLVGGGLSLPFSDNVSLLKNNTDVSKQARFDLAGINTGTTRVFSLPNENGTLLTTGVAGSANQLLRRNNANTAYEFFTPNYITTSGGSFSQFDLSSTNLNSNGFSISGGNTVDDAWIIVGGSQSIINSTTSGSLELLSVSSAAINTIPAITLTGLSSKFGIGDFSSPNGTYTVFLEALADGSDIGTLRITDNRSTKKGLEYAAAYTGGILANNRSIPDIGIVKDGSYTFTNKTISGASNTLTNIPLTTAVTGTLPIANGGTGTATPSLVAGTNVTISGTWPNQTINASGFSTRTFSNSFVIATDANITAAAGTTYTLPAGTLTTNKNIDMTNLNTNGDYIEVINQEVNFTWSFTGQAVYLSDNVTTVSTLLAQTNYIIRRQNGRLIIMN